MTCHRVDIPGGGVAFACTRGPKTKSVCQYCKARPTEFLCDAPLRGRRAGQTCDGKLCRVCAYALSDVEHLCPPHRRERDELAQKKLDADAWLAALVGDAPVHTTAPDKDVDRDALESMFPDWDGVAAVTWWGERDSEPPVSQLAGEMRALDLSVPHGTQLEDSDLRIADAERQRMHESVESHDFDGDTCKLCGTQGKPDGTVDGSCGELLVAQTNMYGCRRCPVCNEHKRWVHQKYGTIICDDCGHETRARMLDEETRDRLGIAIDIWFDDGVPGKARGATSDIGAKVAHVRAARQTRDHRCHWPGCKRQCKPAYYSCREHWYRLPQSIRDRIWRTYRAGQEDTMTPSSEYMDAAREAEAWCAEWEANNRGEPTKRSWEATVRETRARDNARQVVASIERERESVFVGALGDVAQDLEARDDAREEDDFEYVVPAGLFDDEM